MVWGSILASGVGGVRKIGGIMNREKYHKILIHHVKPSGESLHDKPKHAAKSTPGWGVGKQTYT